MKQKLVILLCLITLSCPLITHAEEAPPQVTILLDGIETPITFSTTPEEAIDLLGKDTQSAEYAWPNGSFVALANDSGLRFAGTECMRVGLIYWNSELFALTCYMTADALPDARPLIDEMNRRYGEGIENTLQADPNDPFSFLMSSADWTWSFSEDIRIEYWYEPEQEAFAHMIVFESAPVEQKLNEALNQPLPSPPEGTSTGT